MTDPRAEETRSAEAAGAYTLHIRRLVGLFVGIGVAEIVVMVYPTVYDASRVNSFPVLWFLMIVVFPAVIAGCGAAVGLCVRRFRWCRHLNEHVIDRMISGGFVGFLVVYAFAVSVTAFVPIFPTFMTGELAARTQPLTGLYIAAAAATVVLAPTRRVAYIVALAPLLLMMHATSAGHVQPMSIKEVSLDLATNLASVGVLAWVLRQAGVLDSGSARYRAQAVVLAADRARSQAQRRANSFIHDHILSALIAVANGLPDRAALRASARQTLDSLSRGTVPSVPVAAGALLNDIASRVDAMAGNIRTVVGATSEGEIPADVAQAITEATLEAVRNSLRHAGDEGSSMRRTVTLTSDAASLTIEVSDDGRGFDPNATAIGRHGVSGSIVARMHDAGGEALIHSAPNQGTTVTLKWTRPGPGQDAASAAGTNEAVTWSRYLASSPESVGARLIGACLISVHIMMVVHECCTDQYRHWEPVMVSLVLMLVPAVLLLWSWPAATPPNWVAWLTVVIVGVANLLVLNQIVATGWPGYSSWCTGAGTDLCCVLIIRGRPRQAWAGIGMITVMVGYWVVATGRPLLMVVTYMMGHYFMITAWQGIAHLSTRATTQIAASQRETARLQAQQRAHEEADRIMTSRMASVRQRVTPLLTQIADGRAPTPELRGQAYLLEAELRDEIRAPFFTGTSIVTSAHAARRRGTEVILLDDSGDNTTIDDHTRTNAVNYVTKLLDLTQSNRVVIRLNPPRRPTLLTIVTDDTRYRLDRQGELIAESAGGQVN